jgi:hypothetical protein
MWKCRCLSMLASCSSHPSCVGPYPPLYGCNCSIVANASRDPRQRVTEVVESQRERSLDGRIPRYGDFETQREVTISPPFIAKDGSCWITADEFESQVIQCGAELINNLPSQDRDANGRLLGKTNLLCAVHLIDNKILYILRVSGGAYLQRLQMLPCSRNFVLG